MADGCSSTTRRTTPPRKNQSTTYSLSWNDFCEAGSAVSLFSNLVPETSGTSFGKRHFHSSCAGEGFALEVVVLEAVEAEFDLLDGCARVRPRATFFHPLWKFLRLPYLWAAPVSPEYSGVLPGGAGEVFPDGGLP